MLRGIFLVTIILAFQYDYCFNFTGNYRLCRLSD